MGISGAMNGMGEVERCVSYMCRCVDLLGRWSIY